MTGDVGSMLTSCEPVSSKEGKPLFEAGSKKARCEGSEVVRVVRIVRVVRVCRFQQRHSYWDATSPLSLHPVAFVLIGAMYDGYSHPLTTRT